MSSSVPKTDLLHHHLFFLFLSFTFSSTSSNSILYNVVDRRVDARKDYLITLKAEGGVKADRTDMETKEPGSSQR